MKNSSENLHSVLSLWKQSNSIDNSNYLSSTIVSDLVASLFSAGPHYYFIMDFYDLHFAYVHPAVEDMLGCKPEAFNFAVVFDKMHPDDAAKIHHKESAAVEFFYKRIPVEKIPSYKSTYTFRLSDGKGGWKNILHQSIALQVDVSGKIQYVLSVHTDITYLNLYPDDRISFLSINNEPSYFSLSTDPATLLQPQSALDISYREKEIVRLLAQGLSSKQIGASLYVSQHTVDTHRRNLLKKTGAKNTLELTALCLKRGVI